MGNNQDSGRGGPGLIRTFFDIVTKSQDSSGSINSLNREVAQLTEQVKALGSIRVANGTPTVVQISGPSQDLVAKSFGGLAVTMAALYSYCYFKGVGYNDIAYVTKSLFKQTVSGDFWAPRRAPKCKIGPRRSKMVLVDHLFDIKHRPSF